MTESHPLFSTSPSRITSPASTLLTCARQLEEDGHIIAAGNAYQAAALSDETPQSRVELASFQFRIERFEESRRQLESLVRLAVETGDEQLAEVALHNLAAVLRATGRSSLAATFQASASRQRLNRHGEYSPADLTGRALDAISAGDPALAESLLLRSLAADRNATADRIPSASSSNAIGEADLATDWANLGAFALRRGDTAVAIRFLGRAFHAHRRLKQNGEAGKDLLNLAEAFRSAGRWSLVARCLIRAIRQFEHSGSTQSLSTAQERLAEIENIQSVAQRNPLLN